MRTRRTNTSEIGPAGAGIRDKWMQRKKKIILTFTRHYLPGYKSGGAARTITNLVDQLGGDFEFCIITADRDALDRTRHPDVRMDDWNRVGKASVYYMSPVNRTLKSFTRLISRTPHSVLYLNSFFDPKFTLLPLLARRLGRLPNRPVIVAPRGEFSAGALALKRRKKLLYLAAVRASGLYHNVAWQASSNYEACDIRRVMSPLAEDVMIAPDLPSSRPTTSTRDWRFSPWISSGSPVGSRHPVRI